MYLRRDGMVSALGLQESMSPSANNGPAILAVTGAFTGFAGLVVIMRIYVRAFMLKSVGTDDWIMMAAMLASGGVYACFIAEVNYGVGHHMANPILASNLEKILHWFYFHGLFNVFGISTVKVSIGFFLLRLVQGTMYKRILIAWITFLIIFGLASCGTIAFDCSPIYAAWDFAAAADPKTRCFSTSAYRSIALVNGAINAFTDFAFALLPLPIIIPLKINRRTKISLICILSLGYFACAASLVKEVLLSKYFTDPDPFFQVDSFQIWNDIELNVGILAACLPALRPLVARLLETASALRATGLRRTALGSTASQKNYRQKEEHNMGPMPARPTTALGQKGYRIAVIGGPKVSEDGVPIFDQFDRRPSLASSGPMSKLEQSITEGDSEKDYEDMAMHFDRRFRVRSPVDREFDFQTRRIGILRTTEVTVER